MDILTLHRKGHKQRAIARRLGISRNTVKKYIENPDLVFTPEKPRQRKSLLDPFDDNITAWLNEDDYTATWIYDRLVNMGFAGSYEIVKRKVHQVKGQRQKLAYMRFETEPGFQAQVDLANSKLKDPVGV